MAANEQILTYKGRPLMRHENIIYYGSMSDKYIIMLQILESKKIKDMDVATRVSVQLQYTDPNVKSKDRVVKKSEKDGLYNAMDIAAIWLERALSSKGLWIRHKRRKSSFEEQHLKNHALICVGHRCTLCRRPGG